MYRVAVAALVLAGLLPGQVLAADVQATSKLVAVTVFPMGAEVTRRATVKLEPGQHTIVLPDLPAQTVQSSIRVEATATGGLEIGSVDNRRLSIPRADAAAQASEQRRLETELEAMRDRRALIEAETETAEVQRTLLRNLANLPNRPPPGTPLTAAPQAEDWPGLLGLIGKSMTEVSRAEQDARARLRDLDRAIADVEAKLGELSPVEDERTEIKVHANADAALEATLIIRYQVPGAAWQPFYDARLATGSKTSVPKLEFIRRAAITQSTGEAWSDVELTLSTSRPKAGSAAPDLQPVTVDIREPVPPRPAAPVTQAPAGGAPLDDRMATTAEADAEPQAEGRARGLARMAAPAPARVAEAVVETSAFQALYRVPGAVSVPATGEAKRVQLARQESEPQVTIRTVPKVDDRAYLYVKFKAQPQAPFLPGAVSLFRDGTFVGTGRLPLIAGGDEHELGFGVDDLVRVRYTIAEEKKGESGIISASRTDARQYKITVKNLHERSVAVSVLDQVPASRNDAVTVELTGRNAPSRSDVDGKRGVIAWDFTLAAEEEKAIDFAYRIAWPAAKQIEFGR
ncbi:MAG: mucoidy inhibitor MuiA family protein [Hyphomicrobiaceae bacterium]|nr:mucoidy inhibitor MuiA family protein [Hyphomicrobiaceae bacterium]